ncbi:hypothetical protein XELAEV_180020991mg, partial [Xenopus laevis]
MKNMKNLLCFIAVLSTLQ